MSQYHKQTIFKWSQDKCAFFVSWVSVRWEDKLKLFATMILSIENLIAWVYIFFNEEKLLWSLRIFAYLAHLKKVLVYVFIFRKRVANFFSLEIKKIDKLKMLYFRDDRLVLLMKEITVKLKGLPVLLGNTHQGMKYSVTLYITVHLKVL